MKKVMFLMAVAGMFAFAACNNNAAPEATDSTMAPAPVEEMAPAAAETVDSMAQAVEGAAEATADAAAEAAQTVAQ